MERTCAAYRAEPYTIALGWPALRCGNRTAAAPAWRPPAPHRMISLRSSRNALATVAALAAPSTRTVETASSAGSAPDDGPPPASGTSFQATLAAVLQAAPRVIDRVREAERAALSLAQRERLAEVAADLEAVASSLQSRLDAQGHCLLGRKRGWIAALRARFHRAPRPAPGLRPPGQMGWLFALSAAVEALDEAAMRLQELVAGQPAGTPAAALGREFALRLGGHRDRLLAEADRWDG